MADTEENVFEIDFETPEELEEAYNEHISKFGYFIASDEPLDRTSPVVLRFNLPGLSEPFEIKGEVAFSAGPEAPMPGMGAGMAIQFKEMGDKAEKAFKAAITIAKSEGMDAAPEDDGQDEGGEENEATTRSFMARLNMQSGETLYFEVRKMPMHQKVTAAKRGNRTVRNILLQEGNKKIISFMLQNPQLSTPEVIQMLKMPNLSQEIIKMIAKNSTFSQSEEVKYQIVTNPRTPLPQALNTLISLNQNSLAKIAKSGAVRAQIKSNALKLLEQRRRGS